MFLWLPTLGHSTEESLDGAPKQTWASFFLPSAFCSRYLSTQLNCTELSPSTVASLQNPVLKGSRPTEILSCHQWYLAIGIQQSSLNLFPQEPNTCRDSLVLPGIYLLTQWVMYTHKIYSSLYVRISFSRQYFSIYRKLVGSWAIEETLRCHWLFCIRI